MSAPSSEYYATLLQTLHQITSYLITTLTPLPTPPRTVPRFLRPSMRDSLWHRLTCAEKIYKVRLAQGFRDDVALIDAIVELRNGPRSGGGTDWRTHSDEEWDVEAEELRNLGETWVLLLQELGWRIEGYQRSIM